MDESYRVHYKKGDFEVEVESTDKDYVDDTLNRLIEQSTPPTPVTASIEPSEGATTPSIETTGQVTPLTLDVTALVTSIHESPNYPDIEKHIISKRPRLPRIIMILYFAKQLGLDYLTTSNIEGVTDQLGIKISHENVAKTRRTNRKYFNTKDPVARGKVTLFKLNRQGLDAYEKCLKGEDI